MVAGGFVIADKLLPRIRSYHQDGRLDAAFGRFGDGPFEFRQIRSLNGDAIREARGCRTAQGR